MKKIEVHRAQIVFALRQSETGTAVDEVGRKLLGGEAYDRIDDRN